ncbi:hypothetical protein NX784_22155 [Massilia pinisoli]|uniref:Uncharacterized protein n=1 Tax=Massilia pinisoli TaxID=1772194 RepID=A0ABT1ZWK7_9BURK|nr:hypothetical protein [Massilia pinisoli]MCS0584297.1 hypothetical protein [Massilia pinisoli]
MNTGVLRTGRDAHRRAVLAATCAVHLLVLLLWAQARRQAPPASPARVVTILLQADGARATSMAESSLPPGIPVPVMPPPRPHPPAAALPDTPPSTASAAAPDAPTDVPAGATANTPAPGEGTPPGGFTYSLAARQAGRIDRELRNGKPGVPTEADTASARFRRGLESAHVDRSMTIQTDTYTSPDGVVMYRYRTANGARCRRAGGVGILLQGMPDAPAAMNVDCPKGVEWNRDAP